MSVSIKNIYRVELAGEGCASGETLAALRIRDVPGVDVVSVDRAGVILALSTSDTDTRDDIVAAVVAAGFPSASVQRSEYRRLAGLPLTPEEAALEVPIEPPAPVRAEVEMAPVQRIRVEVTDGYDPAHLLVKAGIPVEIAFGEGHGCLAKVLFESLGIEADLEEGGAIVRLPALEPGIYPFNCGMRMVHGTVTAE